ncbi:MAG: hypothetical protein WA112_03840 [Rugosibacter sp.]|jgi:hypothetical protein|nr:hypothetical protein [Rugosibacter sp.]
MAKPNYSYEKRQRDLAKKQKKEEKRLRKQQPGDNPETTGPESQAHDAATPKTDSNPETD